MVGEGTAIVSSVQNTLERKKTMSILLGWIKDILFSILLWLVLFPIVMILATPVILSISIFGKNEHYLIRVANGYWSVFDYWIENGLWCLPWNGRPD